MHVALRLSVFRSTPYQRWRGATLLARPQPAASQSAKPRVGVAIGVNGHAPTISVGALADRLAAEPGIASVSVAERASPGNLRRLVRTDDLDQLVVGAQCDELIGEVPTVASGCAQLKGTAVRVVDLARLCGPVRESEKATAKALVLLLAAVARLRSPGVVAPADLEEEIRAVLGGGDAVLSPCVPVLTCPAGLDSLRMIGQIGAPYLPGAIPVEVPCHLNMDRRLTARALELGAIAVLVMGCVPGCARDCRTPERQAKASTGRSPSCSNGNQQPLATMTAFGFKGFAEALGTCLDWL